jgi:hypothetical protein
LSRTEDISPFKDQIKGNIEPLNKITLGHLDNEQQLCESVKNNKFNFMLILGKGKQIQLVHSAILAPQDPDS